MRLRFALVAIPLVLAACSSGSSGSKTASSSTKPATPTSWDSAALASIQGLAGKVTAAAPGQCADFGALPLAFATNLVSRHMFPIPRAVGDCTAFATNQEFVAFGTPAERDAYVASHRRVLCALAKRSRVPLQGLHWALGDAWLVQSSAEGPSRRMADALGATYASTACPGYRQIDWDTPAVQRTKDFAAKLSAANVGCADWQLADRETMAGRRDLADVGVPAAEATCTVAGVPVTIDVFGAGGSATAAKFVPVLAKQRVCGASPGAIVLGADWAVFVATPDAAKPIARALDGTVAPANCV